MNGDAESWSPEPVDTSHVTLPVGLEALVEILAENAHDTWAALRIADGWRYGPRRDDRLRTHPDLVPYADLPPGEQRYDREMALNTLKVVVSCGYTIVPPQGDGAH